MTIDLESYPTHSGEGKRHILFAEDEVLIAESTALILETLGYSVTVARNGEEAIQKFLELQEQIDLLLLDMNMPQKSGKDIFEELKSLNPNLKVVLASGYFAGEEVEEMIQHGLNAIVKKPYTRVELSSVLSNVLSAENSEQNKIVP